MFIVVTRPSPSFADDSNKDVMGTGIRGTCTEFFAAIRPVSHERSWANPLRNIDAAGMASLTEISFRTGLIYYLLTID